MYGALSSATSVWGLKLTLKCTAERSREQMRMSKHLQELVIGEQVLVYEAFSY